MRIALRDINKKGVEIGERQNRCHDDSLVAVPAQAEYGKLTCLDTEVAQRKTCEILYAYLLIGTN